MADDPLIDLQALFPGIQEEAILKECRKFDRNIVLQSADPDDEHLRETLDEVWLYGNRLLKQDQSLNRPLASEAQFYDNVKNRGEDRFFSLLRDRANEARISGSEACWAPLVLDDVFYCAPKKSAHDDESSSHAVVHAWKSDFKGGAVDSLLNIIGNLLSLKTKTYAKATTCIINSSGTGKSRMVDELSKFIITVPMCLRRRGSQGFPPPDVGLRNYLEEIGRQGDQGLARRALHGIVYGILTITREQLASFSCDIDLSVDDLLEHEYVDRFINRQRKLARDFHEFMTKDQSFETVNGNRKEFYRKVIEVAKRFEKRCKMALESSMKASPRQYADHDGVGVRTAGKVLCEFVEPRGIPESDDWRCPLVVLSFDESHTLLDGTKEREWTLFSELCHILECNAGSNSIFSLFLSTAGYFQKLPSNIKCDPSSRVVDKSLLPFRPITEISFDCLARPTHNNGVTLRDVVQIKWIAYLGRPLFGSYFDNLLEEDKEDDILLFAKQKLLYGKRSLEKGDSSGSLACLATRFGLEFNEDEDSRNISYMQVERHMRICIAIATGFTKISTCSASEPLLAEAAFHLLSNSSASPVKLLANHTNLHCVDRGRRGELVAALIVMQARDASLPRRLFPRRWVPVTDFIKALLPPLASESFLNSLPTRWFKGEQDITLRQRFADCRLWFNHVIKVEDSDVIRPEFLWKYITRGAMIVCKVNQEGIDLILPVSVSLDNKLSPQSVTAITIQVKNTANYGLHANEKLFDAMDPSGLGLLPENPQPIIRMVFALASPEAGISFPARCTSETPSTSDTFTSYDIWCAGLSTETFRQIGHDLDSYLKLLDRSQRSHDAFDVSESHNPLSEETKIVVGKSRRSMAPLVKSRGHDDIYQSLR